MRPALIIELNVAFVPLLRVMHRLVRVEIDLLMYKTPPQPFAEAIIPPLPVSIHAESKFHALQKPDEFMGGELTALIPVEDLWGAIAGDSLLHHVQKSVVNVLQKRHANARQLAR